MMKCLLLMFIVAVLLYVRLIQLVWVTRTTCMGDSYNLYVWLIQLVWVTHTTCMCDSYNLYVWLILLRYFMNLFIAWQVELFKKYNTKGLDIKKCVQKKMYRWGLTHLLACVIMSFKNRMECTRVMMIDIFFCRQWLI